MPITIFFRDGNKIGLVVSFEKSRNTYISLIFSSIFSQTKMEAFFIEFSYGKAWSNYTALRAMDCLEFHRAGFEFGFNTNFQHDLTLSFDKRETYKSHTHDIAVNVKTGKWKDLAIQCGAKVNADNGRKSPPLLTSGSRDSVSF